MTARDRMLIAPFAKDIRAVTGPTSDRATAVEPVSIVLALDASGSMKKKESDVIASAREFVAALRPQDRLAVVLFADYPVFTHDLTDQREAALAALDRYRASGGTALYDTLAEALLHLKRGQGAAWSWS